MSRVNIKGLVTCGMYLAGDFDESIFNQFQLV